MPHNPIRQIPSSSPLHPKHPTTEPRSDDSLQTHHYPRTHTQAAARFHHHWQAREYATAADYAALAHALADDAGDVTLAARYAQARQLAHKYQALKVEMQKVAWHLAVEPILDPDDPPSSEARCNMVCKPDRPELLQQIVSPDRAHISTERHPTDEQHPTAEQQPSAEQQSLAKQQHPVEQQHSVEQYPSVATAVVVEQRGSPQGDEGKPSGKNILVNRSQPISRYDDRRPAPVEMDIDGTLCCFPITWAPWKRKR